jgi:hypothetical protein
MNGHDRSPVTGETRMNTTTESERTHRHLKFRSRRLFTWVFRASPGLMTSWDQFESMLGPQKH